MGLFTSSVGPRLWSGLSDLHVVAPVSEFPARALQFLGQLIRSDHLSYNEIDRSTGAWRALTDPPDVVAATTELVALFSRYIDQHPVIDYHLRTGDGRARLLSDFRSQRELSRLALYSEFFRPLRVRDQMAITIAFPRQATVIGVALNRDGTFDDVERETLDLVRPHLAVAYANSMRYSAALRGDDEERAGHAASSLACLTGRQLEILSLVSRGHPNAQISRELGISVHTVKRHVEQVIARLGAGNRTGAAAVFARATSTVADAGHELGRP